MTTSTLEFEPTQGELSVVAAIVEYARTYLGTSSNLDGDLQIDSGDAVEILQRSDLSNQELAGIWSIADEDGDGNLSERELAIAVRLMGWAQSGKPVNRSFLTYSNGPLPNLKGVWDNQWNGGQEFVQLPPVSLSDKIEFSRRFREAGPVDGLLDGDKVRDIYLKTNLSFSDLDRIWKLIDTENRGSLNNVEFAIGMYLIQGVKNCQIGTLPPSIPAHVYDQFSVKSISPIISSKHPPKSDPLPWKSPPLSNKTAVSSLTQANTQQWDVSVIEQAEASGHFDTLDVDKKGMVDGDESARYMLKFFKLSPEDIAGIWDLIDLRRDNKLNKEQLAVAVHLIHQKLEGNDLPTFELPTSLVPPKMRSKASSHVRRASASSVPPKRPPPPIPPVSRKPSLSASSPVLRRSASLTPPTVRPQKPTKIGLNNRLSIVTIAETPFPADHTPSPRSVPRAIPRSPFNQATKQKPQSPPLPPLPHTPTPTHKPLPSPNFPTTSPSSAHGSSVDQETVLDLRAETKQLRGQIEELMVQLKRQNQFRDQNEALKEENQRLKRRLQDMELTITQVIQANEGADRTDELTREVTRLTCRLAEYERTDAELRDTLDSVTKLTRENNMLKQKYEDLKIEKGSLEKELVEAGNRMQNIQGEKNSARKRLEEMERLLADPSKEGSSKKELQMLLSDVTTENEELKRRERDMQQQISTILLTSRNHAQVDDLKRENSTLMLQVRELEEVVRGMQASNSDNVLRTRIDELEKEKQGLNSRVEEMTRRVAGIEGLTSGRIEELERRCRELETTNQMLQQEQIMGANPDESAPPPAYEEVSNRAL